MKGESREIRSARGLCFVCLLCEGGISFYDNLTEHTHEEINRLQLWRWERRDRRAVCLWLLSMSDCSILRRRGGRDGPALVHVSLGYRLRLPGLQR